MIEINLLPGKKKKKKPGAGLTLPDFSELAGRIKDPLLIGTLGVWAVVIPLIVVVFITEQAKLASLRADHETVNQQARRFQTIIRDKRRQERLRDSLLVELDAIREIDADRYVWAHVMEEVTKALPDFTWLVGLEFVPMAAPDIVGEETDVTVKPPIQFTVEGRTADIGAYTRFLRNLASSPWVADVQPGATETVLDSDRPVTAFTITATFAQADSAFIRTAPLQETVR